MRLIGKHQALDGLAMDDMPFDELRNIVDGDIAVPNLLGVHDDSDAVRALIKAPGVIGSHVARDAVGSDLLLELIAHFRAAFGFAAALRVIGGAFVDTYEYVA